MKNCKPQIENLRDKTAGRITLALVVLLLTLPALPCTAGATLRIGDLLPPLTLSSVDGTVIRIPESLSGKVVILHFWQIGCSSCRLEMPAMDHLYSAYRKKGLEILAINVGQKRDAVKSFASDLKVSFPILVDADSKSAALYGVTDVPRTYVIDRSGVIRYRMLGGAAPEILKKLVLSLL